MMLAVYVVEQVFQMVIAIAQVMYSIVLIFAVVVLCLMNAASVEELVFLMVNVIVMVMFWIV
jgi:hypothetical protein